MSGKKDKLSTYTYPLKDTIKLDDSEWRFDVPNLPSSEKLDQRQLVKVITLVTKGHKQSMLLKLERIDPNRAVKDHPLNRFVVISFAEFRSINGVAAPGDSLQPTTPRECTDYMVRLLRFGISLQGIHYNFYGHSNSQLKSRTCFLHAASKEEIARKVEALGDFTKMKTVAKKAKRIGLLFSVAQVAKKIDPVQCEDIPDIETINYNFTDGCGLISPKLAQDLSRRLRIVFRNVRYSPSVLQIRYRGYKGVVTLDPRMRNERTCLRLRKSMKKFSGGEDYTFSVVDYSKPYTFGFLNDEVIILLHCLGIQRSLLSRKQEEHFSFLATATTDSRAAFRFLSYINMHELAEKVLMESLESVQPRIKALVNSEFDKMLNKRGEQKCRILVPKSRLLFGVCDAWDVLKEGECAIRITMDGDGQPCALKNTEVLVTRNPCLHPGDLQKFKVVEKPELAHLVDCIVFSTRGKRPAADMMSGGDLDGDTFFVCWDNDLVPSKISQPGQYPGVQEPLRFNPITDDDRLVYFAKYTNASLGRVKNLYLEWARARDPMCAECQELNRLFSQCVDGNRIKIPPRLENCPRAISDAPPFILDELHGAAKSFVERSKSSGMEWNGFTFDAIQLLLARDDIAMSEFELIKLTFKWCKRNDTPLEDFLSFFDFNVLAPEEKAWVLGQLPPSRDVPSLVMNSLCSSSLLHEHELKRFELHHPGIRWKRYFTSTHDRLATFLDAATRALELYHRKLIVLQVDERLTLGIYIPRKIEPSQDYLVDDNVRLLAFPHSQGTETQSRLALPTKMNYRLYCDENVFQLFEGQRGNTWVFVGRGPSDDSEYRNTANTGQRRRQRQSTLDRGVNFDCRASIALDKFSRGLQRHIGRVNRNGVSAAEIYIISNRDVESMQKLDLWLEHVDTEEKLPLFQQNPKDYITPSVRDVDWSAVPNYILQIAGRQDPSVLKYMELPEEYGLLFAWLLERDQKELLLRCFDYLLSTISDGQLEGTDWHAVLQTMLGFLKHAPFLAISFARRTSDGVLFHEVTTWLEARSMDILRAFVLSANEAQELIVAPFQSFLSTIQFLAMDSFVDLVQLISLTVRSSEVALDLLLGSLEPESSRILLDRPTLIRHFVRNLIAIALDHIGEASEQPRKREDLLELKLLPEEMDGYQVVEIPFRIDSPGGTPENSAHVRLTVANLPSNVVVGKTYSLDGFVTRSEHGLARIQCFHPLPSFFQSCSWRLQNCGPFVTTKTMFDAVRTFATQPESCRIREQILGLPPKDNALYELNTGLSAYQHKENLNTSQNSAVEAVPKSPLVCLWGPPGTGKTETIVEMILELQKTYETARILVTAPTHNAVDNVMRRYIARLGPVRLLHIPQHLSPLRVSTEIRKVAEDLRKYTCDAMAGQDINTSRLAFKQAQQKIKDCQIIFTTCIGSGLGLLRSQDFDIVIVDEASQQTEPASLVPLVKGCGKAILVGDHVQLRPTVQQIAASVEFDVSLFERLYRHQDGPQGNQPGHPLSGNNAPSASRLMLDTQYRMHESICEFISIEFYDGRLRTGINPGSRPLFNSAFPWPPNAVPASNAGRTPKDGERARMVFVECASREDLGHKSKSNQGQAELCAHICKLLCTAAAAHTDEVGRGPPTSTDTQSIAVLTPYTRQADLLKRLLSSLAAMVEVSSIDGFQGREAEIVVFVSVRCNERCEIGFLKDLRRMNVALTRARAGLIVVGNKATLTRGTADPESTALWTRLVERLTQVHIEM